MRYAIPFVVLSLLAACTDAPGPDGGLPMPDSGAPPPSACSASAPVPASARRSYTLP